MNIHATFQTRLRAAVRADGRSGYAVAKASGYSDSHVRRILRGERLNPTIGFVWALAATLGVDPHWLLGAGHSTPFSSATGDRDELLQEHPER